MTELTKMILFITCNILLLLLSYSINAAADSIDHVKGARGLNEFWHLVKAISYAIPFSQVLFLLYLLYQLKTFIILIILIFLLIMFGVCWEATYHFCKKIELYKIDDKWECELIQKMWRVKHYE